METDWIVQVKDRGRVLAWHRFEALDEAEEVRQVYRLLGYAEDRIAVEQVQREDRQAA
jgi:hypothetical protein